MKPVLIYSLILVVAIQVGAQNFDIRFTNPECNIYGDKPKNAFCTRADLVQAQSNPEGPYQKIIELIRQPLNKKITLATMTFSNKGVATELCKALKRGVAVEVLIDSAAAAATATEVESCGARLIKVGKVEAEDQRGDLHHNKFLLVEQNQKDTLVFATGNFSNPGLTINHETWSFVTQNKNSQLIQQHLCLVSALKEYKGDLKQFKNGLNACRSHEGAFESIQSLFVPADSAQLIKLIQSEIKNSSQVLMTSNRYSYDVLTRAFATSKSRDSRAIFDDDLYWGGIQPTPDYVNEALDAKKIKQLESHIPVHYMETSYGAAQKMHNKYIVFDSMVIVGAGNFTYAGMTSNFENFYIIRDPATVAKFKQQFEYLWRISTDRKNMPKKYWDPAAP